MYDTAAQGGVSSGAVDLEGGGIIKRSLGVPLKLGLNAYSFNGPLENGYRGCLPFEALGYGNPDELTTLLDKVRLRCVAVATPLALFL